MFKSSKRKEPESKCDLAGLTAKLGEALIQVSLASAAHERQSHETFEHGKEQTGRDQEKVYKEWWRKAEGILEEIKKCR